MKMQQSKTDYSEKGETGEKLPKRATSSDSTGESHRKIVGGVAMGKADGIGERESSHMGKVEGHCGELNDGNKGEREIYVHKRG